VQDKPGAEAFVPREGAMAFEHLDFSYTPHGPKILDDLSYSFTPGKVTAIVARAGMGKSTLLNLMARLQDPQGGRILIDGQDISRVTLASLRRTWSKSPNFPSLWAIPSALISSSPRPTQRTPNGRGVSPDRPLASSGKGRRS